MSDVEPGFSFQKATFTPNRDEHFDESLFDLAASDALPTDGRDGLPASFRMRHDEHYVERIMTRASAAPVQLIAIDEIDGRPAVPDHGLGGLVDSISTLGVIQPLLVRRRNGRYELIAGAKRLAAASAAGLAEVPCLLQEADDDRARALAEAANLASGPQGAHPRRAGVTPAAPEPANAALLESLATIESCLNLFFDRDRPLRERVALDLIRAEAARSRALAEAWTLLADDPAPRRRPEVPAALAEGAVRSVEAETRLAGTAVTLIVDGPVRPVPADGRLIGTALSGLLRAALALVKGTGSATATFRVGTHPASGSALFQVSQDVTPAPDWWTAPGGSIPSGESQEARERWLGVAAARRVAERHGGRLDVVRGPRAGCTITMVLPAGD